MRVELTVDDVRLATDFCTEFRKIKPRPIRSHAQRVEVEWQLAGKLGEIAVGRVLGLGVNFDVFEHADRGDFLLRDGRTLSVRSVQVLKRMDYPFKVIIRPGEILTDLVSLVLISPRHDYAVIEGYISVGDFFTRAVVENGWGHQGPSQPLTVTKDILSPISELRREEPIEGL